MDISKSCLDKYLYAVPDEPQIAGSTKSSFKLHSSHGKSVNAHCSSQVEVPGDTESPAENVVLTALPEQNDAQRYYKVTNGTGYHQIFCTAVFGRIQWNVYR